MAKHDQRVPISLTVCRQCRNDNCEGCVDGLRIYADDLICGCRRDTHQCNVLSVQNLWISKIQIPIEKSSPGFMDQSLIVQSSENEPEESLMKGASRSKSLGRLRIKSRSSQTMTSKTYPAVSWRMVDPAVPHRSLTDPTWRNDTYKYLDEKLHEIWITQVPSSDEEACVYFTLVRDAGPLFHPRYIQVQRQGSRDWNLLPVEYDEQEDVWDEL